MKIFKVLIACTLVLSIATIQSCQTTDACELVTCSDGGSTSTVNDVCVCACDNTTCQNGGTVSVTGTLCGCDCAYGFTGSDCADVDLTKVTGNYNVDETCSTGSSVFISGVTGSISISNFWGTFVNNVTASVSGTTVTIASQEPDNDGFTVVGTGTITFNANNKAVLNLSYTVTDTSNGNTSTCTAVCTQI